MGMWWIVVHQTNLGCILRQHRPLYHNCQSTASVTCEKNGETNKSHHKTKSHVRICFVQNERNIRPNSWHWWPLAIHDSSIRSFFRPTSNCWIVGGESGGRGWCWNGADERELRENRPGNVPIPSARTTFRYCSVSSLVNTCGMVAADLAMPSIDDSTFGQTIGLGLFSIAFKANSRFWMASARDDNFVRRSSRIHNPLYSFWWWFKLSVKENVYP